MFLPFTIEGNEIKNPEISFEKVVQSVGLYAKSVREANELGPALKKAFTVLNSGRPALIDVDVEPIV